ncbi:MAG: MaoC family dehydratase [Afipia sp.]|nr:MaoC family dehydratase [Afipia sp.]
MPYFEDMKIGDRREMGSFTFTPDLIKKFAAQFDPQPFHLDEEAGRKSVFGGLAASGWHVAAVYMRLTVESFKREAQAAIARGEKPVVSGPSPGFRELKWVRPVLAGDTLTYSSEIIAKRPLDSRPQWGLVNFSNTAFNQRGELAFSFLGSAFMPRKPAT